MLNKVKNCAMGVLYVSLIGGENIPSFKPIYIHQ